MRYLLKLSYDGTRYHGWQIQPNATTVQGVLQDILTEIFGIEIEVTGCGRTDTGVHAKMYYAHFDIETERTENLFRRANFLLPSDIRLLGLYKVRDDFHARFDAISRSYEYVITFSPDPFIDKYSLLLFKRLDFDAMNNAAKKLLMHTEFGSFSKTGADNKTDICKVTEAEWRAHENDIWKFHITSDRFLRGMVRAIVGTLFLVGHGKMNEEEFTAIMHSGQRTNAGESAEAHGLFLCDIKYPAGEIMHSV